VRGQLDRQLGLGHHGVAHHVGQRHLAGGDQVERLHVGHGLAFLAAFFHGKQITFKLGQLAGAAQGVGVDDVGRVALGVAVFLGLHVEHELSEGAVQPSQRAAHEGEARAGQLGAGREIQSEWLAHIHMVTHGEVEHARRAPAAKLHVAMLVAAHRHALVWQVGHGLQQGVQLGLDHFKAGC